MEARLKADDLEGLMDAFLEGVVGPLVTDWDAWNGARAELTPCARSLPRELAAVGQCTRLRPEVFEGFASPTLHVSGSKSAEGLRGWVEPLSKAIPDFRTAGLPGQEHLANYTGPEVVAEAVAKFLGEVT
jgi:pimeloyl-ACP methyl ester carboxylesterase